MGAEVPAHPAKNGADKRRLRWKSLRILSTDARGHELVVLAWSKGKRRDTGRKDRFGRCSGTRTQERGFSVRLLLHFRGPVQKYGGRRGIGIIHFRKDQESLSVATHIVGEEILRRNRLPPMSLEERDWGAGFEAGSRLHRHCHDLSFRRQIEQFLPVQAPSWLLSACA